MPRIKKYKINSKFPEEVEFRVTRITRITQEMTLTEEVDEFGNITSPRGTQSSPPKTTVEEGIMAVSLPSQTPAEVVILETEEGAVESYKKENEDPPIREAINLTNKMDAMQDARIGAAKTNTNVINDKPIVIPKNPEITWANNEGMSFPIK